MSSVVTLVNEIETKVETSAQLLDSKKPGWFRDVDLDDFDIQDPNKCVLYQLYGDYLEGLRQVRPTEGTLFYDHDQDEDNTLTNHAWERAILARRAGQGFERSEP